MRTLNIYSLNRLQQNTEQTFNFTCTINSASLIRNAYGENTYTFNSGSPISCGFEMIGGTRTYKDQIIQTPTKSFIKLPINQLINKTDTITLTKQYNQTINPVTFSIISGSPIPNLDCVRLEVERMES